MSHSLLFINVSVLQNCWKKMLDVFVKPEIKHSLPAHGQEVGSAIGFTY